MIRTIFASDLFRLAFVPIITAGFGSYIRYFTAKIRDQTPKKAEIFTVWPELLIAALFNVLIIASDSAKASNVNSDTSIELFASALFVSLMLWVVSFVAGIPRKKRVRIAIWTYGFPHLVALGTLELSLLLVDVSRGGAQ